MSKAKLNKILMSEIFSSQTAIFRISNVVTQEALQKVKKV